MKIQLYSDLHTEFEKSPKQRFVMPETDADVIVLAGDIGLGVQQFDKIKGFTDKPVIYVAGNHEFYHGSFPDEYKRIADSAKRTDNVVFLENAEAFHDGVRFIGMTMWTDFNLYGNQSLGQTAAWSLLNDYELIRVQTAGYRKLRPEDILERHMKSMRFLTETLAEPFDGPTVVVTHHAPSERSLDPSHSRYNDQNSNCAYASRLDHLFGQMTVWIHGHTHFPVDYMAEGTRVISNPRGYVGRHEAEGFIPDLVIEV